MASPLFTLCHAVTNDVKTSLAHLMNNEAYRLITVRTGHIFSYLPTNTTLLEVIRDIAG